MDTAPMVSFLHADGIGPSVGTFLAWDAVAASRQLFQDFNKSNGYLSAVFYLLPLKCAPPF